MGRALHASSNAADQALWSDWYAWTVEIAVNSCFVEDNGANTSIPFHVVFDVMSVGHFDGWTNAGGCTRLNQQFMNS